MTYKPGQIAKATVRGVPDVTVMRLGDNGYTSARWATAEGPARLVEDRDVTDIRPLVVLDLDTVPEFVKADGHTAEDLVHILRHSPGRVEGWLADQIEAQTRPAIEEPKGLGAVVEDDKGVRWVRTDGEDWPWDSPNRAAVWGEFTPVRVLSEGVPS